MSVVEFIFRKAGKVLNFTKDRMHLIVPLSIWKIFTAYISSIPAPSYLYILWWPVFLLGTRVFSSYLLRWWHWEIASKRFFDNISLGWSTISIFLCNTQATSFWIVFLWFIFAFYTPGYPWVKFLIFQFLVFSR